MEAFHYQPAAPTQLSVEASVVNLEDPGGKYVAKLNPFLRVGWAMSFSHPFVPSIW